MNKRRFKKIRVLMFVKNLCKFVAENFAMNTHEFLHEEKNEE